MDSLGKTQSVLAEQTVCSEFKEITRRNLHTVECLSRTENCLFLFIFRSSPKSGDFWHSVSNPSERHFELAHKPQLRCAYWPRALFVFYTSKVFFNVCISCLRCADLHGDLSLFEFEKEHGAQVPCWLLKSCESLLLSFPNKSRFLCKKIS